MSDRKMSSLYVYWNESNMWGLLLWRALSAWGLPHRLVRGEEIAKGLLIQKPPSALIVPGGGAKKKFEALGRDGVKAIRDYVDSGGVYLGFCGGAGLGLSGPFGLGLCPWKRRAFSERTQHFCSGHIFVRTPRPNPLIPDSLPEKPLVPVWWPARFDPEENSDISVLATYDKPGPDFWVADLPLASLPREPLKTLETTYGIHLWPHFMRDRPCIIQGSFGKGKYVLSYAHLETPDSPDANAWLAHVLAVLAGVDPVPPEKTRTPAWDLENLAMRWPDPSLRTTKAVIEELIHQGEDHLLLFKRNSWLLGWRRGIPGSNINFLYSLVCQAQNMEPLLAANTYWQKHAPAFLETLERFRVGLTGYLLAERLAMTVSESSNAIPGKGLKKQRAALFGPPMDYGGLYGEMLTVLDELIQLLLTDQPR